MRKTTKVYTRVALPWSLRSVVLLNALSEVLHGWLTHTRGTEFYGPVSVGEVTKGIMLPFLVWATLKRMDHFRNQVILSCILMIALLDLLQVVLGYGTLEGVPATMFFGFRFLFGLMFLSLVRDVLPRGPGMLDRWMRFLKVTFLTFYSVPILLAAFGILGFARGDRDFAFVGFVMNQNPVGVVMLALAPFFFSARGPVDVFSGFVFFASA